MTGVALVTGGQQGIGFGIAKDLAAVGFKVAIASRPDPNDASVAKALNTLGEGAAYFQHDVANVEGITTIAPVCWPQQQHDGDDTSIRRGSCVLLSWLPSLKRGESLPSTYQRCSM